MDVQQAGGAGGAPHHPLEAWYLDIPVVSRVYLTAVALLTLACQLRFVTPYHLFLSWPLVWKAKQYWRMVTTFFYFGGFSVDLVFHIFFLVRYCRMLEEGSFRGRTADFIWMLVVSSAAMLGISSLFDQNNEIPFLSSALTFMITYLWARRNPEMRINFLGIFNFDAPYLPWVLIGFTLVLHGVTPYADLLGLVVGHTYYYLEDVYPMLQGSHGHRPVAAPKILVALVNGDWARPRGSVEHEPLAAGLGGFEGDDLEMENVDDGGDSDGDGDGIAAPGGYLFGSAPTTTPAAAATGAATAAAAAELRQRRQPQPAQ